MYYLERKETVTVRIKDVNGFARTVKKERWRGIQCSDSRAEIEVMLGMRRKSRYRIAEVED